MSSSMSFFSAKCPDEADRMFETSGGRRWTLSDSSCQIKQNAAKSVSIFGNFKTKYTNQPTVIEPQLSSSRKPSTARQPRCTRASYRAENQLFSSKSAGQDYRIQRSKR